MKAKLSILYFLLWISVSGFSQSGFWTISGIITEEKKNPAKSAHVFVNNTSIGIITNENGNFLINIPNKFSQIELIVLLTGHKTIKRKVNFSTEIQLFKFQLEYDNSLKKVMDSDTYGKFLRKKRKLFEQALLGNSKLARQCKILNLEAIELEYDKDNKLIATANDPIIIENRALGYKILFQMEKFETDGISTHASGQKFFEIMDSVNSNPKKKWEKNRKEIFYDSFQNFLLALALNNLNKNRFEVFKIDDYKSLDYKKSTLANKVKDGLFTPVQNSEIFEFDKDRELFVIHSEMPLLIFLKSKPDSKSFLTDYPYQYSVIFLTKGYSSFSSNGLINRPADVTLKGYWKFNGFANLLPDNYSEEEFTKESSDETIINKISKNQ
ncbi:carboxypeptidase-like regulatory domain-containing protein [Emticicia sp. BO119]|uniref:carboxypeptidase-like regulatory domain-containing protein n=1 Tax=Emticicia sp. BO119 TaxID=2757768 RepID=UPI0015F04B49|nr:carboxypeptidase-like regulatory domain-containing protein [Emticicia sp. BO119]MBA4853386.1 carboxypeptidase-like regulatory domain-containing protein [Emticicia sp. BO119]